MRVPLSWLPSTSTSPPAPPAREVAASLVSRGSRGGGPARRRHHRAARRRPGALFADEPQKNGKTIRWCTVDVGQHGQMATDGMQQEIVCGAHNFEVGDLVVVVLPGAVLPGGFAIAARKTYGHVSNGMICAEDELGSARTTAASSCCSALGEEACHGVPRRRRHRPARPRRRDRRGQRDARPGLLLLAARARPRVLARPGLPPGAFRDPAAVESRPATDGLPRRLADERPARRPPRAATATSPASCAGSTRTRPSPAWMQRRLTQMGMRPISLAVDVTNYVMLATGQPLHAFDLASSQRPIVVRRARPGERLTTLDGVERTLDPEDLLITDGGDSAPRPSPGSWAARRRRSTATHARRARRGRPLRPDDRRPHHAPAPAGHRGLQALRARRRPAARPRRRPAGGRPARRARRWHADPDVTDVDRTAPARLPARRRRAGPDGRGRLRPRPGARSCCATSAAPSPSRSTAPSRDPAVVAPRPRRRARLRGGGRADRRLRRHPSLAATADQRPGAHPRAEGAPRRGHRARRARPHRGAQLPLRARRWPTSSACPPTTTAATPCGSPTR